MHIYSHVAWERSHGAGGSGSIGDFGDRNGKEAGMYIPLDNNIMS
jgi:hypothetical protein